MFINNKCLSQVWLFLQHYLHTAEKRSLSAAECLAFLYQLSFSTLGKVRTLLRICYVTVVSKEHT